MLGQRQTGCTRALAAALLLAGADWLAGCVVPPYQAPTANEPHAVVQVRRVYKTIAGTELDDHTYIDGQVALADQASPEAAKFERVSSVLVYPRPTWLGVGSSFYHLEQRYVYESYLDNETYNTTETYYCGSSYSCTRTVTRTRLVTKWHYVYKYVAHFRWAVRESVSDLASRRIRVPGGLHLSRA
jgi:hypothetical protein